MRDLSSTSPDRRTYLLLVPGLVNPTPGRRRWIEPGEPEVVGASVGTLLTLFWQTVDGNRTPCLQVSDRWGTQVVPVGRELIDLGRNISTVVIPRAIEITNRKPARLLIETMSGPDLILALRNHPRQCVRVVRVDGCSWTWKAREVIKP